MARLVGINHVAVEVGDVDEALAWLGRIFDGVRLRGRSSRMAFVALGDQFIALAQAQTAARDSHRHIGLVVDDRDAAVAAARAAGAEVEGHHDLLDPWGNRWQLVDYREIQFTKAPEVLAGMGFAGLEKTATALAELRAKGLV